MAFFRHAPAAVCRGRGERVEAVPLARPLHFVLVCPPVGLSTADVYRSLTPPERPRPIGPVLEALVARRTGRPGSEPVQPAPTGRRGDLQPALVRVRDALASLGPSLDGHLMSGSGSAYFGLCRDRGRGATTPRDVLEPLGLGRVRVVTCGP